MEKEQIRHIWRRKSKYIHRSTLKTGEFPDLSVFDFGKISYYLGVLQADKQTLPDGEELIGRAVESPFLGHAQRQSGVDSNFEILAIFDGVAERREHVGEPSGTQCADQQRRVAQHVAKSVTRVPTHLSMARKMI